MVANQKRRALVQDLEAQRNKYTGLYSAINQVWDCCRYCDIDLLLLEEDRTGIVLRCRACRTRHAVN